MKSFATISAIAALAASAAAAPVVQVPSTMLTCQPQAITWSGAKAPVYISYIQGKDTSSAPIEQFPAQQSASGSYVWTVNQPVGTQLTFIINDADGTPNYSSQTTIQAGTSTSCIGNNAASASSGGSSSSSSAAGGASSSAGSATSSAAARTSSAASGASSRASSAASAASPSSSSSSSGGSNGVASLAVNGFAAVAAGAAALFMA
ncbi:hypothetical protein BDZ90DRAFT_232985 [Jaminaea rosea]|uniref:Ser-Thr-rich glycosyl-phosphatidyl-inositol-anchored membrane family-domain-containing protein n=1 Tax=Jaminaea rosea TaxID=1569628 RepID=A0A316URE6_9BASI|nr:hypothetical protein BDZ90DRAFT_232985 [Jaminaea rosea]PWN26891.1 hypothetical protein BDZ90DRAFT_232985 [Jaminaea rosea]